jgi:hypothetical protein
MNVYWKLHNGNQTILSASPVERKKHVTDSIGRFGLLGIILISISLMALGFSMDHAGSDICLTSMYLECVR